MRHKEYDCDHCGQEVPDGHGNYLKDDRVCSDCYAIRQELKATLENALKNPEGTIMRVVGEYLMTLNPPID